MMTAILENTAYFIGIGVEAFAIIVCVVLLALMLSGALFKWMAKSKVTRTAKAAAKAAAAEARAAVAEELAAQEAADAEAARAQAEIDAVVKAEAEAAAAEAAEVAAAKHAKEQAAKAAADREANEKAAAQKAAEKAAAAAAKAEEEAKAEETVTSESEKVVVKERVIERTVVQEKENAAAKEAAATQAEENEDDERDFVVVHDGIVFNDSKSVTELYEELTPEQQSYFDELREEALTKPDAELAISKNFVSVKIGKRNLIKLLIKRGVTVAEFMLENDALKQLRLSNTNKRGKSTIKVKPTVVQVLDLASLKVAVDMINLAYEELMLGD